MCDLIVRVRNCGTGTLTNVTVGTNNTGIVDSALTGQFINVLDNVSGQTIYGGYIEEVGAYPCGPSLDSYGKTLPLLNPSTNFTDSTIDLYIVDGQHSEDWYTFETGWVTYQETNFIDALPASIFSDCEDIIEDIESIKIFQIARPYYIDGVDVLNLNANIQAKVDCNKAITFTHGDSFYVFVENRDHTLSIYSYDAVAGGNPIKYDCCSAELINALTNTSSGTLPNGDPIVGTGLFDYWNRIIDETGADQELKFTPYYIPSTEVIPTWCNQCMVTPTDCSYPPIEKTTNCYMLIPCDDVAPILSNDTVLENYKDTFINITSSEYNGCVYVTRIQGPCTDAIEVTIDTVTPCDCDVNCYFVQGTNGFIYVDANDVLQEVSAAQAAPYIRVCSKTQPVPNNSSTNYIITNLGLCVNNECPEQCYKLTNCDNPSEVIYTKSDSIIQYVYGSNNVVKVLNKTGCYIASELDPNEVCDCPISVTVTGSYTSCDSCKGYKAYKLTSCDNGDVVYTTDDLEAYIGKTVKIDCGCYIVELINFTPSGARSVVVEYVYDKCTDCTTTFFQLRNCETLDVEIYTATDLSAVIGQAIKIDGYNSCFTVEITQAPGVVIAVTLSTTYPTCDECILKSKTCKCQTAVNDSIVETGLDYIDCDGNPATTASLTPGQRSGKYCVLEWTTGIDVVDYGDCIDSNGTYTCPQPVYPTRPVIPGYNVPTCDIEKYEKITCKTADILYKSVLEKRYGISNCCPEDDMKWLIKKELIDLQALNDSNYTCSSSSSSCTGTTTCNCGCNNIVKSCNS